MSCWGVRLSFRLILHVVSNPRHKWWGRLDQRLAHIMHEPHISYSRNLRSRRRIWLQQTHVPPPGIAAYPDLRLAPNRTAVWPSAASSQTQTSNAAHLLVRHWQLFSPLAIWFWDILTNMSWWGANNQTGCTETECWVYAGRRLPRTWEWPLRKSTIYD